jgi:hypothetical protein
MIDYDSHMTITVNQWQRSGTSFPVPLRMQIPIAI